MRRLLPTTALLFAVCLSAEATSAHGPVHDRIAESSQRIASRPEDLDARLQRALLYREEGDFAAALADLNRIAELDPARAEVDYQLGIIHEAAGRFDEAEAAYRARLRRGPESAAAHAALGRSLASLERHAEAAFHYERALALEPAPTPGLYLERARAYAMSDASQGRALRGLDEAISILGPVPSLANLAIEIELRRGNFEAALERHDRAFGAGSPSWLVRRADLLEQAGRSDEARASYRSALSAVDRLPSARRSTPAVTRLVARCADGLEHLSRSHR